MAKKKKDRIQPRKVRSRQRRALKTWEKGKLAQVDVEAVPTHGVSMKPRVRDVQKKHALNFEGTLSGRIIGSLGRAWLVQCDDQTGEFHEAYEAEFYNEVFECFASRSVVSENKHETLLAVGDKVRFRYEEASGSNEEEYKQGIIIFVEERGTKLTREAAGNEGVEQVIASNIDCLIIFMAAVNPFYNTRLIDRYLVMAEHRFLKPIICINKIDLVDEALVREDLSFYTDTLGVPLICLSALSKIHIEEISEVLRGNVSVFSGPSGAGKSTLVNYLLGEEVQVTTEVSEKTSKGMHTTTFSRMFDLPAGGAIIDTPGIREFGISDINPEDLSFYFHDFDEYRGNCRFPNCTHTHEPHCGVKDAVEEELITIERYASYLNIFETLPEGL